MSHSFTMSVKTISFSGGRAPQNEMPFPRRITVHAVCSASQDLLEAVEREPKAAAQAAVIAASAGVRQALRMPSAALANA